MILYIHPFGEHPSNNDSFYLKKVDKVTVEKDPRYYSYIPMGLIGAINNLIRNGYQVEGINLPLKKALYNFDFNEFAAKSNHKIFLIDIHWYSHLKSATEILLKKTLTVSGN